MNLKYRYVMKYLGFRFLPQFVLCLALSAALIFLSGTNNDPAEQTAAIIVCALVLTSLLTYYIFNIISFLNMINRQEKQYKIALDDKGAKAFSKRSLWIICSDNWLIRPGRFAIYRKEIKSASIGAIYHEYKSGITYPVRIKTHSGKAFKLKFKNEKDARSVRSWARK